MICSLLAVEIPDTPDVILNVMYPFSGQVATKPLKILVCKSGDTATAARITTPTVSALLVQAGNMQKSTTEVCVFGIRRRVGEVSFKPGESRLRQSSNPMLHVQVVNS